MSREVYRVAVLSEKDSGWNTSVPFGEATEFMSPCVPDWADADKHIPAAATTRNLFTGILKNEE